MNEKYKYLGKNTLLFTISSFGTRIISFFLMPLYTNILTTAEYGTADLISTTATLLVYVLTINIADSVLRFALDIQNDKDLGLSEADRKKGQQAILSYGNRVLLIGTLVCVFGLAVVYSLRIIDWPPIYFAFVALYFFATAFYQMMSEYLRAIDKVAAVAAAGVISASVTIVGNILLLLVFNFGIIGYLASTVAGPFVAAIYCVVLAGAPAKTYIINSCSKAMEGKMRAYCIPLIFNSLALWVNGYLDRFFVTAICGVDANGVYSVATKIPVILATCYGVFGQAWNLSAIKEFDSDDSDGFFSKTYAIFNAAMCVICSLIIICNVPLARFLYAKDFFEAWQYSDVLLLYILFNSLTMLLGSVFSAVMATKTIASTTIISALCNTALNALLIPFIGPLGAAIATVTSYLVMWAMRLVKLRKYMKLRIRIGIDCIIYGVIVLQVFFDHIPSHFYFGQAICFAVILIVYRKYIKAMVVPVRSLVKNLGR